MYKAGQDGLVLMQALVGLSTQKQTAKSSLAVKLQSRHVWVI